MCEPARRSFRRCFRGAFLLIIASSAASLPAAAERRHMSETQLRISQAPADPQRGRLLYDTYCIGCHTTQAHWRDQHIVRSWQDLLYQVTRMQANAGQTWGTEEILDVAVYLNDLFYHLPCPATGCRGPEASVNEPEEVAARQ